jgi:hypothetical protein
MESLWRKPAIDFPQGEISETDLEGMEVEGSPFLFFPCSGRMVKFYDSVGK